MIKFCIGDMFSAPKGTYLLHACNCMGMWGSGVAYQFRVRFPESYLEYQRFSETAKPGDTLVCSLENGYQVVCLFTSKNYGKEVDAPYKILEATQQALVNLPADKPIHMPKINAGLFCVPWEHTAALLGLYDNLDITVWSLE